MKMNEQNVMWCVTNSDGDIIFSDLSWRRKDAIDKFIEGSRYGWQYWRKKHGYKVQKVIVTITPVKP